MVLQSDFVSTKITKQTLRGPKDYKIISQIIFGAHFLIHSVRVRLPDQEVKSKGMRENRIQVI